MKKLYFAIGVMILAALVIAADKKVSEFPNISTPDPSDLMLLAQTNGTPHTNGNITVQQFSNFLNMIAFQSGVGTNTSIQGTLTATNITTKVINDSIGTNRIRMTANGSTIIYDTTGTSREVIVGGGALTLAGTNGLATVSISPDGQQQMSKGLTLADWLQVDLAQTNTAAMYQTGTAGTDMLGDHTFTTGQTTPGFRLFDTNGTSPLVTMNTNGDVTAKGALISSNLTANRVMVTGSRQEATNLAAGTLGQAVISTGSGVVMSNVWVKEIIRGSSLGGAIVTGQRALTMDADQAATYNVGNFPDKETLAPISGYLTNFQVWSSVAWPATTNAVFTVYTNVGLVTPVATLITCTLSPSSVSANTFTNSGTTTLTLPATQYGKGYVWYLDINTTSPGGTINAQSLSWSIEWWHP